MYNSSASLIGVTVTVQIHDMRSQSIVIRYDPFVYTVIYWRNFYKQGLRVAGRAVILTAAVATEF